MINEAIRLNAGGEESLIAIETSGHAALKENFFLDDGAYLVARILIKVAQLHQRQESISDLIGELQHPLESVEYRLKILHKDFPGYGKAVIEELGEAVAKEEGWVPEPYNFEGIRVRCTNQNEKGWFLLRLSLHDPVMPLNIESDLEGGTETISRRLHEILSRFDQLDLSSF